MRYLRYLLNDSMHPETFISDKKELELITTLAAISASVAGMIVIVALVPGAGLMDLIRIIKLRNLQRQIKHRNQDPILSAIRSLGHYPSKKLIHQLKSIEDYVEKKPKFSNLN